MLNILHISYTYTNSHITYTYHLHAIIIYTKCFVLTSLNRFLTAPSGIVQILVSSPTPSTVTLQWDRVSCLTRNSEITGYEVTFGPTSSSTRTTESITGTEMRTFTATDLIPRIHYTFQVTSLSDSGNGPSAIVPSKTTLPSGIYLNLVTLQYVCYLIHRGDVSV